MEGIHAINNSVCGENQCQTDGPTYGVCIGIAFSPRAATMLSDTLVASRYREWSRAPPQTHSPGLRPIHREWSAEFDLSDRTLNRSLAFGASTSSAQRLARFVHRVRRGQRTWVAVLGASVTYGHGIEERPPQNYTWPSQLERALRFVFGSSAVRVHNAAMPSTTAAFAAMCIDTLVPMHADLIAIEYSFTTFGSGQLHSLIEQATARGVAVLLVDFSQVINIRTWRGCRMGNLAFAPVHDLCIQNRCSSRPCNVPNLLLTNSHMRHRDMLAASGLTVISNLPFATEEMPTLELGGPQDLRRFIARDGTHLSSMGHWLYARFVMHALWTSGGTGSTRRSSAAATAEEQIRPSSAPSSVCTFGPSLESLLVRDDSARPEPGWKYVVEMRDKPGLVCLKAGEAMELQLEVPKVHGNAMILHLLYLKSYEHMGQARFECRGGCTCATFTIDAHNFDQRDSLETPSPPIEVHFDAGGGRPQLLRSCRLHGRTLTDTSSGEHKFKVTAVVVAPLALVKTLESGIKDVARFVDYSSKQDFAHAASLAGV